MGHRICTTVRRLHISGMALLLWYIHLISVDGGNSGLGQSPSFFPLHAQVASAPTLQCPTRDECDIHDMVSEQADIINKPSMGRRLSSIFSERHFSPLFSYMFLDTCFLLFFFSERAIFFFVIFFFFCSFIAQHGRTRSFLY